MPGMNLKGLSNPAQRLATGKILPVKQLEAVVIYGRPEQRVKVIEKVIAQTAVLSMTNQTQHLVTSVIRSSDNLVRARILFDIRRKITEMARSKIANTVLAALIETSPAQQRKEIAEAFTVNVSEDELLDAARHEAANHVIQKLLEYPTSAEVLAKSLQPHLSSLATHPIGQHVAAKVVTSVVDGSAMVVDALFPTGEAEEEVLEMIYEAVPESAVLCALIQSAAVDDAIKASIQTSVLANLKALVSEASAEEGDNESENDEPSFGPTTKETATKEAAEFCGRQNFLLAACLENGTQEQLAALLKALAPHVSAMAGTKGQVAVVASMVRVTSELPAVRKAVVVSVLQSGKAKLTFADAAKDVRRTIAVRALVEAGAVGLFSKQEVSAFIQQAADNAVHPVATIVLQRLVEYGTDELRAQILKASMDSIAALTTHTIGSYFVQQLLESGSDEDRTRVGAEVVKGLGDFKVGIGAMSGSRTLQKATAYVSDKALKDLVKALTGCTDEDDDYTRLTQEEKEAKYEDIKTLSKRERKETFGPVTGGHLYHFALHPHACFAVQSLLRETKRRGMDASRKALMNSLKPYVFDLAVSPWAGRVVLDAMLATGSIELKEAIKNVVFLKAENWLTEPADNRRGGMDPTMRRAVRGDASGKNSDRDFKRHRSEPVQQAKAETPAGNKKAPKKIHRSLKR